MERLRDENDGRRSLLSLTASGKRKARELERLTEQTVDALLAEIPAGKRKQVIESIRRLRTAAEGLGEGLGFGC